MTDIDIRVIGHAGRITFTRPQALNALSHAMSNQIDAALQRWADDPAVKLVVIDAQGDRAFCAGGDIAQVHAEITAGDYDAPRTFWRDEYRMNARMFHFPKPVVSLMQGFTMGGGVGVGCHGSHRIVGESSKIAMPECAIGLIPDVGGSLILARAPGRLGEYLGTTGHRMGPDDAILAGFADYFVPQADWPALITMLEATGDWNAVDRAARPAPAGPLRAMQAEIDAHFSGEGLGDIVRSLRHADSDFTHTSEAQLMRGCPLSMACTIEMIRRLRVRDTIEAALIQEFRFTYRIAAMPDLAEGIRAAVIDKDRAPEWQHPQIDDIPQAEVSGMLLPLGVNELKLEDPS